MADKSQQLWNRLRSAIKDCLTFAQIKDAAGRGGLPLEDLAHLQQRQLPARSASKSELLDAVGVLLAAVSETDRRETMAGFLKACLAKYPDRQAEFECDVVRCGLALSPEGALEDHAEAESKVKTLSSRGAESQRTEPPRGPSIPSVFVSYCHADVAFKTQLATHLKALSFSGRLTFWSDDQIKPGADWFSEITNSLNTARVAVLLVSGDFLASDFIREHELNPILQKHREGSVKLLWVPVRACNWEETQLSALQAVVPPQKPLAEMKAERDRAWVTICKAIKAAAGE